MSGLLSRSELAVVLAQNGFVRDSQSRRHAEGWTGPMGERVHLKMSERYPLVIEPRYESRLAQLLAVPGVIGSPERYAHNTNFADFPKRMHTGKTPIAYGLDFGFESEAALQKFLDRLLGEPLATKPVFDAVAHAFLDGFLAPDNPQFVLWLPRYRQTLQVVREALERGAPDAIFELVWKSVDNAVSNAGQGVLGFEAADFAREPLVDVIREIGSDGSAERFERLMARMGQWKQAGDLPKVPRLLLARAFAAIHPERFHTTVDGAKQDRIIPWFEAHTGFVAPGGSWATRAQALTEHLDRSGLFGEDWARRNMFPWYVFEQLRDASGQLPFRPGHVSRVAIGQAASPAQVRTVEYRQNVIQDRLVERLRAQYGHDAVGTEHPTGTGGRADALVEHADGSRELYEIKPAMTAREAVRQAIGQLLEYAWRRHGLQPAALHVVSDAPLDEVTGEYLRNLEARFGLCFGYMQVDSGVLPEVTDE